MGENLATIGYNWLAQFSATQRIVDKFAQSTTLYHLAGGIVGQSAIQGSSTNTGPYVDLPVGIASVQPQSSSAPTVAVGPYSYPKPFVSGGFAEAEALSSFESAVLEQTQAGVSGATAASSVKIIDANMNPSYSGSLGTTYFADGTTAAGRSQFTSTIQPAISPHYSSADLAAIQAAVTTNDEQVLIPQNGQLSVGIWMGAGYTTINPISSSQVLIVQKISGGMSGGFFGVNDPNSPQFTTNALVPAAGTGTVSPLLNTTPPPDSGKVAEPVDGVSGAYLYHHDDLTIGTGPFPYALSFSRNYLSSAGTYLTSTTADTGLGNGWTHNFALSAQIQSDPYAGIGSVTSPALSDAYGLASNIVVRSGATNSPALTAVSAIAALYVMNDLLGQTPTVQTMTISSMVAHWYTDQLTSNAVIVSKPDTSEEYIAQPHLDGASTVAYTAPPNSSVRLSATSSGQISYLTKDGQALTFGPTPTGALQSWTFPNGMSVNLTYAGSQLVGVANSVGHSLTLSYSGADLAKVTDDAGRSTAYTYDANHNLIQFTDPLGYSTRYLYDASRIYDTAGHLTQIFYPSNPTNPFVTNWYDSVGRVVQQANANGYTSNLFFAGSRSEFVDAVGNRHVAYQNNLGRTVVDTQVLSGAANVFSDTPQTYGVYNVTYDYYDGQNRLFITQLPETGLAFFLYSPTNAWANNIALVQRQPKVGSSLGALTTLFTYDPTWNKPTSIADPLGLVTTATYDPATGNRLSVSSDVGSAPHFNATRHFTYDARGRVLTTTDPLGALTTFDYDAFENLIQQVADVGPGHINAATRFAYDPIGNLVSQTDPNGNATSFGYDAKRRLVRLAAPAPFGASTQTRQTYDADDHVLSVTRSNGPSNLTTVRTYTPSGQVQAVTDPNGNTTTFAYDPDDRLVSVTDPLRRTTAYSYDALSRLTAVSNLSIQAAPLVQFSYTPDGYRASLTDANNHATIFAYDGYDRLATTTYPDTSTEQLTYDADSNVVSLVTRRGDTISFTYDTLNRLSKKEPPSPTATVNYSYDLNNRLISANDNSASLAAVSGSSTQYATNLAYDQLNRLTGVNCTPAPAQATPTASAVAITHAYDATNRRVGQAANDNNWISYPSAAASVNYTSNSLNQYSAISSATLTYDGNGNLTFDGTFAYSYDAENRLTQIQQGGSTVATYTYDSRGRRKSKTVGSITTVFVTDADGREVLEYDGTSGAAQRWYAYGTGLNDVLNQMDVAGGTRTTLVPDIQGSIVAGLASGGGSIAKSAFQPYGENTASTTGTFRYTGQRFDGETASGAAQPSGLYYYRTRMYSPTIGRFFQPDPIGYSGGANLYAYVLNDPLNRIDPLGLTPDNPQNAFAAESATGAFNPAVKIGGDGLGIFADRLVTVTPKGLDLVSSHLSQFDFAPNDMMLQRLQAAADAGVPVTGADAVFYTHEAAEATMMSRGMTYDAAHAAALEKYGVSPYSVYHPDVIQAAPESFNSNWRTFWKIGQ